MLTEVSELIAVLNRHLKTGEATRTDFDALQRIPYNIPLQYLPGVVATRLPVVIAGTELMLLEMEAGATTGKILHNCKKRAVCMEGGYKDDVSRIAVAEGSTATWQANTPHIITAKRKSRILLQFNR